MNDVVSRAEFTEMQIQQRLLQQSFATIADNTTEIRKSVREFTVIAGRMEELIEHVEEVRVLATRHEQEFAIMRSHKIVETVSQHASEMPGLLEIRRWVVGGVLAIVGSTWLAASAIIFF